MPDPSDFVRSPTGPEPDVWSSFVHLYIWHLWTEQWWYLLIKYPVLIGVFLLTLAPPTCVISARLDYRALYRSCLDWSVVGRGREAAVGSRRRVERWWGVKGHRHRRWLRPSWEAPAATQLSSPTREASISESERRPSHCQRPTLFHALHMAGGSFNISRSRTATAPFDFAQIWHARYN